MTAEVAGLVGDTETCVAMIAQATATGLFDLHWADRCPVLGDARGTPRFARAHARIQRRAEAILDAMHGDLDDENVQTSSG